MINWLEQVEKMKKAYPDLVASKSKDGYVFSGLVTLNAEYDDVPLYDEYIIEIQIPFNYPKNLPVVTDLNNAIPQELEHFYSDGTLCLGAACDLLDYIENHASIVDYVKGIVMSYLYTASYFRRYGTVPYGERSHGIKGIEEAYMERYNVTSPELLTQLLLYVVGIERYRGHMKCPCNSGLKFRDCHGNRIMKDIKSEHKNDYISDAYSILMYYIRLKEQGGSIEYGKSGAAKK